MGTATARVTTLEKRNATIKKYTLHFYGEGKTLCNPTSGPVLHRSKRAAILPDTYIDPQQQPFSVVAEYMEPQPRPNIKIRDLADRRTLVYGLPAMTAKVRNWLRHEGFAFQFPSLESGIYQRGYTVVEPARPEVVVRMSELQWALKDWRITPDGRGMLSLTPAPFQFGCSSTRWDDKYFSDRRLHSTTYYPSAERAEAQQTIARNTKCLDTKDCIPVFETNASGRPESPMTRPGKRLRNPSGLREKRKGNHDRTLWERKWRGISNVRT